MRNRLIGLIAAGAASLAVAVAATTFQNVAGNVTDQAGDKIPDIQVRFFDATNAEMLARTITDLSGRFDTGLVPIGDYRVQFFDPADRFHTEFFGAGGIDQFCAAASVTVMASSTTTIDQVMRPWEAIAVVDFEGPVAGTVFDRATQPLPGIRVSLLKSWNAEPLATTVTDANGEWTVGLKGEVLPSLRIRFSDPAGAFVAAFYGAGTDTFCTAATVSAASATLDWRLERLPPEQLTEQLTETVQSYDLTPSVATMLGTSLTQVRKLLADDADGNTAAACGQLTSFLTRVDVQERRGELTTAQSAELRNQVTNLTVSLGCR